MKGPRAAHSPEADEMHGKPAIAAIMGAIFMLVVGISPLVRDAMPADACSFLTRDQVSTVLGVPVGDGKLASLNDPHVCEWSVPGGPTLTAKKVVLTIITMRAFSQGKVPIPGITKTPVSRIGDAAYYVTAPDLGTTLDFRKESAAFKVSVQGSGFSVEKIKEKEKTLAQTILADL
jgi:hypothetical protein